MACQTQWVYAGMSGQAVGLNYPGVECVIRAMKLPLNTLLDVQLIERGCLQGMSERQT